VNRNRKATAIEASVLVVSGVLAAALGDRLADHGVSIAVIVSVTLFILTTGQYFANSLTQALRTTLYTCPTKGCPVYIRARDTAPAQLDKLRALATDHSKHGGAR
jgi:hypothetical protein